MHKGRSRTSLGGVEKSSTRRRCEPPRRRRQDWAGLPPYADRMISDNRYSMMDCLMCDKDGPHYQYSPDKENVFQCSQCFALFTDSSPKWSA